MRFFLSFRGEDTRKSFVDHLYHALDQRGIITYKDDIRLEKGENISDQLVASIQDSRFHILVFSKNYASSSWCLEELVKIMECQKTSEQTAFPLFYDVEPTHVRNQSGPVGEAFAKHVTKDAAGRWRDALKQASDLAGWELKNTGDGHEVQFIKKVVEDIFGKLHFTNFGFNKKLVAIETRVENILSSLEVGRDDVRMIGIKGMGGGGKTTLARVVFDHISCQFEGTCFVENVGEGSKASGLKELQQQVLQDVLNDQNIIVRSISDRMHKMEKMMPSRKLLLVLDDVDHLSQLEALVGEPAWFKAGSKIIITTRDEHLLVAHGVQSNNIHDVNLLTEDEAICLLSRYAFRREVPDQGYDQLSREVIHYAAGLPLTIKVLGSDLCCRTKLEWKDVIEKLKTIPEKQTLARLELSYIGLTDDEKEIFLEVACILKGEPKYHAIKILESCGYHAAIGLKVLEDKSLINISSFGKLDLHDLIEEMGKNIVRRSHPDEPEKHSRLWIQEEIVNVLVNDLGTGTTRSLKLENSSLSPLIIMQGLRKFSGLKFLYVSCDKKYHLDETDTYFPVTIYILEKVINSLRFLNLSASDIGIFDLGMTPNLEILNLYQFDELDMSAECPKLRSLNLGDLCLRNFNLGLTPNLEQLILEGCENSEELNMPAELPELKTIDLSFLRVCNLNLVMAPNLEKLKIVSCLHLEELHLPDECPKLRSIYLRDLSLWDLNLGLTPNLEELILEGCKYFEELNMSAELPELNTIVLSCCKVRNLNLVMAPNPEKLVIFNCLELVELHMPVGCPKLRSLNLTSELSLRKLNLGLTPNLKKLKIEGCEYLEELNMSAELPKLKTIYLSCSKVRNLNLVTAPNIEELEIFSCLELVELHLPVECPKLRSLNLSDLSLRNFNLGLTPNLEELILSDFLADCEYIEKLNMSFELQKLNTIDLSCSKGRNLNVVKAPNLEKLEIASCLELVELHMPFECHKLRSLNQTHSGLRNLNLKNTLNLEKLKIVSCLELVELHMPVECSKLRSLNLTSELSLRNLNLGLTANLEELILVNCEVVELNMSIKLPHLKILKVNGSKLRNLNLGLAPNLKELQLEDCFELVELNMPIECSQLRVLRLSGFKVSSFRPGLSPLLEKSEQLEELFLHIRDIKHLPDGIWISKNLKKLSLHSCWLLDQLPEHIGRAESLELLDLTDCISLRDIPNSICNMKYLRTLRLSYCFLVEKLPEEFGRLESLKWLNIAGAGIKHPPQSIFRLKGLRIEGHKWRLESYAFTTLCESYEDRRHQARCFIDTEST